MASKQIFLEHIGNATITKRKGQRSIRLSIQGGKIIVSQPSWLPYSAGEAFLHSKSSWIQQHHTPRESIKNNSPVGKNHQLSIVYGDSRSTRLKNGILTITLKYGESETDPLVQDYLKNGMLRALRHEAKLFLPAQTELLAHKHGFSYKSVSIKQLKRRWGSCNSKKELTFNLHLMGLEHQHIDYVILHELCHTVHMNHGPEFWALMEKVYPGAKKIAKVVRRIQF